ncbi:cytosolic sulfotransferase 5-like [Panicum miliaceum]|uniref:Sulfotransferase n=1 Tax=Panicum miliaceum TaxID=4540 RepID=A0A3L6T8V5_PANMI|nr:cytosolic sulfotransferase 5-like [Panicum miliaceum]
MARGAYPLAGAGHPLLRLNPHDCIPFMEMLFADGSAGSRKMVTLPSPRLMATHMHHAILHASLSNNPDCKIVYICRNPKDMLVSLWHFARIVQPDLAFSDVFEHACEGVSLSGPIWDHVLGYWNASKESPETVLFLRYEEILLDPAGNVRKLARFVGQPLSPAEEEAGVAEDIARLCSFDTLRGLEVNRAAASGSLLFPNSSLLLSGEGRPGTGRTT